MVISLENMVREVPVGNAAYSIILNSQPYWPAKGLPYPYVQCNRHE